MSHPTPLRQHFKGRHIWLDMAGLAALFVVAAYVPLLKIVPLIASLELFSFFCYHLLARRSRLQLQGFLGGFISSTAVFIQLLNDKKYATSHDQDMILTLLLATCAMLLECLFIVYFLSDALALNYYLPFIVQLAFLSIAILIINLNQQSTPRPKQSPAIASDIEKLLDHPIVWKNVIKLSLIIFTIITITHYIGNVAGLSRDISTLIISLFEAHAVLASLMTEWTMQSHNLDLIKLFFMILLGNVLSKTYLVTRGKNLTQKRLFVAIMAGSLMTSLAVTALWPYPI